MTRTIEDPRMTESMLVMGMNGEEVAEMRVRKTREGKPKSRNGCRTCKLRRVKCDETKPHCMRCTRFGQRCDGYIAKAPSKQSLQISTTRALAPRESSNTREQSSESPNPSSPSPSMSTSTLTAGGMMSSPSSSNREIPTYQNQVDWFSMKSASYMSPSPLDMEKWKTWIGQACEMDEEIRYAVCTLGVDPERRGLVSSEDPLTTSLTGCLMLYCFDKFGLGSHDPDPRILAGLHRLRDEALAVIEKKSTFGKPQTPQQSETNPTEVDIAHAFDSMEPYPTDELALQAYRSYIKMVTTLPPHIIPETLETVSLARSFLERVLLKSTHYIRYSRFALRLRHPVSRIILTLQYMYMHTPNGVVREPHPLAELEEWDAAFGPLLKFARSKGSSEENFLAASWLRLCWLAGYLGMKAHWYSERRTPSAEFLIERRKMGIEIDEAVSIAELLLKKVVFKKEDDDEDSDMIVDPEDMEASPASELQVIIPLVTIAWCCRHRSLRRRVGELLSRCKRKEGIWDGMLLGKVMLWLEETEEEGLEGEGEDFVPHHLAVRAITVGFEEDTGVAEITCLKPRTDNGGWDIERRTKIAQ